MAESVSSWTEQEPPGPLVWLQGWYTSHCDGDWEHDAGISITTLDNPGWRFRVELSGTELEPASFERVETHRAEHDWYVVWVEASAFEAACGPINLGEVIHIFRTWAQR